MAKTRTAAKSASDGSSVKQTDSGVNNNSSSKMNSTATPPAKEKKSKSQQSSSSANLPAATAPLTSGEKLFAGLLLAIAMILVLGSTQLARTGRLLVLQPSDRNVTLSKLTSFSGKLEVTAKYWILGLVWLYIDLHLVIYNRITRNATNPLSLNESRITAAKNIFVNSMEQFVLSIVSQTAVLPYLTAQQVLAIIPLFNAFFLIGRIFFWLGYPKRRSFGFCTTTLPVTIAIFYAAYQFVTTHLNIADTDSLFKLTL